MKANLISKEKNVAKFTMVFTPEEIEQATIKAYQQNKENFTIDGFRKGKAPRSIIEKHYGDNVFTEEAINIVFNDAYPAAIADLNLEVIEMPSVEFDQFEKGAEFTATVSVAVYPEVEVKDYFGVEIEKIDGTVTEEEIDAEIENMRKRNARMVAVEGRPAKDGDTVLIDYAGFIGEEQFEGGTAEQFPLKLGSGSFIPGFEEKLVGACVGEDRDLELSFPTEYHAEALAGKDVVFKCKVHEIKEEELPELNDEFAKDVSEFDTLDEFKADLREKMGKAKADHVERQMQNAVLEKIYNANEIDVPDSMVQDEINQMINEFDQQLRAQGMDLQTYMGYLNQDMNEFRAQLQEDGYRRVKTRMIVSAIADAEKVEVSEDEVNEEIAKMAAMYGLEKEKVLEMIGSTNMAFIEKDIKMRKAMDVIFEKAVIK